MNEAVTRKDIDEVIGILHDFMKQVDDRFNGVEQRLGGVEQRLGGVEQRLSVLEQEVGALKASHDRLLNTIDGFIGRIDKYETELAARDHQFEKLLAWARKVSAKTGIPLENL